MSLRLPVLCLFVLLPLWAQRPIITTIAGTDRVFPRDPIAALQAPLGALQGIAIDSDGSIYTADVETNIVVKISRDGMLRVVAGNGFAGVSGDGGPGENASLNSPLGLAVDRAGNLYIAEYASHRIRKISPGGIITTIAGSGLGPREGAGVSGDGGPASQALLNQPSRVVVDPQGRILIADLSFRVRRIELDGTINTIIGGGTETPDGVPATRARLSVIFALASDNAGNTYVSDTGGTYRVSADGIIRRIRANASTVFTDVTGADVYVIENSAVNRLLPDGSIRAVGFSATGFPTAVGGTFYFAGTNGLVVRQECCTAPVTLAGNGQHRISGDGGPAIAARLAQPYQVEFDAAGNLIFHDAGNNRFRRISPDGVIQTIYSTTSEVPMMDPAGNLYALGGDTLTRLRSDGTVVNVVRFPQRGLGSQYKSAVDTAGNAYYYESNFQDANNFRARLMKIAPNGQVQTISGSTYGFAGDGGKAVDARITTVGGIAVDAAGNLYLADSDAHRIRKITPDGNISTIAGSGAVNNSIVPFSGEGGPATSAQLSYPSSVSVDTTGNVYIVDGLNPAIRRVSPTGIITTVAGGLPAGFSGDGGPATQAALALDYGSGVAIDRAGNLFITDTKNNRIRAVLATPPAFLPIPASMRFQGASGAAPPPAQSFVVASSVQGLPFTVSTGTSSWLNVSPTAGAAPRLLQVTANTLDLAPGEHTGSIVVSMPDANPPQRRLDVAISVGPAAAPWVAVDKESLSFTYTLGGAARTMPLTVSNRGGGRADFTVSTSTKNGGSWLNANPAGGTATPLNPVVLSALANPAGLPAGTYTGTVSIHSSGSAGRIDIPVTMTVSTLGQAMLLSQTGLSFTGVSNGGLVPPQSFGVLNLGRGVMNWTVTTSTLSGGQGWLTAAPVSGASDAAGSVPLVEVRVSPAGLAPGGYYGQVQVTAPEAANTPQVVTVFFDVLPATEDPGAALQVGEMVFTGVAGTASPGSRELFIYNPVSASKSFRVSASTESGGNWLRFQPAESVVTAARPARVVVQAVTASLPAGVYRGAVDLQFSDGRVRSVAVTAIVARAASSASAVKDVRTAGEGCSPGRLVPALLSLGGNFRVAAGWPVGLMAEVKDDCGVPVTTGSVVVNFSNGDTPVAMVSLRDGLWQGTWQAGATSAVTLRVEAESPGPLKGTREVSGDLGASRERPSLDPRGVISAASGGSYVPVAPGGIISLYGERLAEGAASAAALPLPTRLAAAEVVMAGRRLPLIFAGESQINAVVPYDIQANTNQQLVVRRGATYSFPVSIDVGPAQPAIFLAPQVAPNQGIVYAVRDEGGTRRQFLASTATPARAGDVLVIYCTGLGAVTPAITAGDPSPAGAVVEKPVTVTVGGVSAPVIFAGPTPGFTGLYQVNVAMPLGIAPGGSVPVIVETQEQTSPAAGIAVQ